MNGFKRAALALRLGFEDQFRATGSTSLLVGLACNLAFAGQTYFWPVMQHTSVIMVTYTDAAYVAELLCALIVGARVRRSGAVPPPWLVGLLTALVAATMVLYCALFEAGVPVPDPVNWACGAILGIYLTVAMLSWFAVCLDLRPSALIWNIMLAAVFAAFAIWIFSDLDRVKVCVCSVLLVFAATLVLVRKLGTIREGASAPAPAQPAVPSFRYPVSATFLFSFAFITAIAFAGIRGESASFSAGAFFAPMMLVCAAALLVNVSAFPLASIAVPAIVMATIAASSLNIDPALSFDIAALGMFLFLAYSVVLLCAHMRTDPPRALRAFLNLVAAFAAGCLVGRACMVACTAFLGLLTSDMLIVLSILAANAAMVVLVRRGGVPRSAGEVPPDAPFSAEAEQLEPALRVEVGRVAAERNLGEREKEVLTLLLEGKSASEVARAMVVAKGTAKSHIRHVYRKLGIHSRDELFEMFGIERE
ncbi:helix-turn-helix transcriptional regulator [Adlercreutzia sp. R25]|uniref:Helix-turn-helix transcriptional regulator n=1 Tax=Adlercreutzia shanghongiae TaxID=3111773 RepID=A0ABU6IWY2_9ACTN|nr:MULTISPECIES: helix-turn-helix transcriptional regulator [unclassified Adlercreutzia]MEC4272466.1 helix-turn-helix transcriptional regulator [Adlercreutzia sp. R25]MEC4294329.1 helix-turn-helix transcriptional regulator [Adlercreutzia sp. R22]